MTFKIAKIGYYGKLIFRICLTQFSRKQLNINDILTKKIII